MIKFFRKIRKELIEIGNLKKYFLYALGEILLVVIGILIALQINNQNEVRKKNIETKIYLQALILDLKRDTILIHEELERFSPKFRFNESLRSRVASQKATIDTLIKIARYELDPTWYKRIVYNTESYNKLIQTGLIENLTDSLIRSLKNFYNEKISLNSWVEKGINDYRKVLEEYPFVFANHPLADQGPLIDSLIWTNVDTKLLAFEFNSLTLYKRLYLNDNINELNFSLDNSRMLLKQLSEYLNESVD